VLAEVKKIVDASTGRPIWMPNMIGGAPDTILGYPYFINQSMAVAAGSGSGKSILFGQLSKYIIRDVRDVPAPTRRALRRVLPGGVRGLLAA
jgi:HK97 family phage major capsid protein